MGCDYTSNQYVDSNSSAVGVGPLPVLMKRVTHTDKDSWVSGTQQSKFVEMGTTHNSNRDDAKTVHSSNKIVDKNKGDESNKSTRVLRSNTKLVIEPSSNIFSPDKFIGMSEESLDEPEVNPDVRECLQSSDGYSNSRQLKEKSDKSTERTSVNKRSNSMMSNEKESNGVRNSNDNERSAVDINMIDCDDDIYVTDFDDNLFTLPRNKSSISNKNNTCSSRYKSNKSNIVQLTNDSKSSTTNNSQLNTVNNLLANTSSKDDKDISSKCDRVIQFQHLQHNDLDNDVTANIEDFQYLVGTKHIDDDDMLVYKTVRVYIHKSTGFIVGDRVLVLKDGQTSNSAQYDPVHIRDLALLTDKYNTCYSNNLRCNLLHLVTGETSEQVLPVDVIHSETLELDELDFCRLVDQSTSGDDLALYCLQTMMAQLDINTPSTRKQALASPQREEWVKAELKEIEFI